VLIEFSVANFRSFASEQTLSLNAGRFRSERVGAVLNTGSKSAPHLLRVAAILGANGAGKSNLISALAFLQSFVANSAQGMQRGDTINVEPFRLDADLVDKPSRFEIVFLHERREYHYTIATMASHVTLEKLHVREHGKGLRELFCRERKGEGYVWSIPSIPQDQADLWRRSTRENGLFLSQAVQLNSEEFSHPFLWITEHLKIRDSNDFFSPSMTSHLIKDHIEDGCQRDILNLLRESDLGIRDVIIEEIDFDESQLPDEIPEDIKKKIASEMKGKKQFRSKFAHNTKQNSRVLFDYEDESQGTQQLFNMAGHMVSAVRHNYTIVIDEIEASLHPYLLTLLIRMFQFPIFPDTEAQLVFATHSDSLLDSGLLERDQFWFVEKHNGESEIVPLNDFKPRKGEAIRLNYLKGRYGGVPAIAQSVR
jgi:uncharacterized protein